MATMMVDLTDIRYDDDVYPRQSINEANISRLKRALEAGAAVPPILLDEKTMILIDGKHRVLTYEKLKQLQIPANLEAFKTKAAMLARAISENMHGAALSAYDLSRCVIAAQRLGLTDTDLAYAMHSPVSYVEQIRTTKQAEWKKDTVPIKRTLHHLAQHKLTKKQLAGNKIACGLPCAAILKQAINLFENDLIDLSDALVMQRIQELKQWLKGY
jgi:hypothetical protein